MLHFVLESSYQYNIGIGHKKINNINIFKKYFFFNGYTAIEKLKIILGSSKSFKLLWEPLVLDGDSMSNNSKLSIPIYILHGVYDYQVSYQLAKEYFDLIDLPKKEFITFDNSAHAPFVDENAKFIEMMDNIKTTVEKIN